MPHVPAGLLLFDTYVGFEDSVAGYRERMSDRLTASQWHYIHIWCDNRIIGQLEFRSFSETPGTGYVHLIYLIPSYRDLGVANIAEDFIAWTLTSQGCKQVILSVSRTNQRAVKHYMRHGWEFQKSNPKHQATDSYVRQLR